MSVQTEFNQQHEDCVELIQLTDIHLFADEDATFDGIDTLASLKSVIDHAKAHHWPPDLVLVTGDLVHDPVQQAYEKLLVPLKGLDVPVFCLPGNHDEPDLMHKILAVDNIKMDKCFVTGHWVVFMLDSYLPGTHSGHLARQELEILDQGLARYSDKFALICLHHPPVSIGSSWMDAMSLDNPDDLFAVTDKYLQVQGIVWGHVHQEFTVMRNKVMLMASPSTCVQFVPGAESYLKDDQSAGYRRFKLYTSGEITTNIVRI